MWPVSLLSRKTTKPNNEPFGSHLKTKSGRQLCLDNRYNSLLTSRYSYPALYLVFILLPTPTSGLTTATCHNQPHSLLFSILTLLQTPHIERSVDVLSNDLYSSFYSLLISGNMKSSIFLAATGAALALSNPLNKRVWETDVVTEYYTVTVTGDAPKPTPTNVKVRPHTRPYQQQPPVEQPEPTTTSQAVVIVTVTPEAEPTTTTQKQEPTTVDTPAQATNQVPAEGDSFQSEALYHHNIHRSNHSSPAVSWNPEIAGYAGNTAATCKFAHDMYVDIVLICFRIR